MKLLIDIVMNPKTYYWVANVPGQFDAAEHLFNYYWEHLGNKTAGEVERVLLRSGKYITTTP